MIATDSTGGASRRSEYPLVLLFSGLRDFLAQLVARNVVIDSLPGAAALCRACGMDVVLPYVSFAKGVPGCCASVSRVSAIMCFDEGLRYAMLRAIEPIEKQAKEQYRLAMCAKQGDAFLHRPECFRDAGAYRAAMGSLSRELRRRARKDACLRNAISDGARVPSGIALGAMSLGTFSRLVGNTRDSAAIGAVESKSRNAFTVSGRLRAGTVFLISPRRRMAGAGMSTLSMTAAGARCIKL